MSCSDVPSLEKTIDQLTACLHTDASIEEIEHTLYKWDRRDREWGGVSEADVAPGGGREIIIRYYPERIALYTVQARFAVLQRGSGQWQVLFDDTIAINDNTQWHSEIIGIEDATGDGYDDILMELTYASRYTGYDYGVLLTAHPNGSEFRIAFSETEETPNGDISYEFIHTDEYRPKTIAIQSVEQFDYYHVITQTYSFNRYLFEQIGESRYPHKAEDIPPQYRLGYDPDHDWHVYRCDQEKYVGDSFGRICGMNTDGSQKRLIISDIVSPILVSPDGQWLVFSAPLNNSSVYNCQKSLWKMSLTGSTTPLISPNELPICYLHNLEWQPEGDKLWVQFRNWEGGEFNDVDAIPSYRVNFEDGTLKHN
jgi:hypothetical protein